MQKCPKTTIKICKRCHLIFKSPAGGRYCSHTCKEKARPRKQTPKKKRREEPVKYLGSYPSQLKEVMDNYNPPIPIWYVAQMTGLSKLAISAIRNGVAASGARATKLTDFFWGRYKIQLNFRWLISPRKSFTPSKKKKRNAERVKSDYTPKPSKVEPTLKPRKEGEFSTQLMEVMDRHNPPIRLNYICKECKLSATQLSLVRHGKKAAGKITALRLYDFFNKRYKIRLDLSFLLEPERYRPDRKKRMLENDPRWQPSPPPPIPLIVDENTEYIYQWGNTPERLKMKGRKCLIKSKCKKWGSVIVEFIDNGQREEVQRRSVRMIKKWKF